MGTNYYLHNMCAHCGRSDELHIGKSSVGWNFGLRVYPETAALKPFGVEKIETLDDWRPLFERFAILDEYQRAVTVADLLTCITERKHPNGLLSRLTAGAEHMGPFRSSHDTWPGPPGSTYDLCGYEFS